MVRKFALAIAALVLVSVSLQARALGLGEISLNSGLNEPMDARIDLLSVGLDELESMSVRLADSAAFAQSGLERPFFLTQLRFKVIADNGAEPYVQISSKSTIREPFVSFLVELDWANGKLLREYTVLLDPPTMVPVQTAPPVSAPAATVAPAGSARPVGSAAPAPARQASVQQRVIAVADGEYGPTQRRQTLWGIAEDIRPDDGVSIEQTMLSLLRNNPNAFYGNNINRLKAGHVMRVPSREDIASLTQAQALRDVSAHYREWREFKAGRAAAQPQLADGSRAGSRTQSGGSRLKLVAPDSGEEGFDRAAGQPGAEGEAVSDEVLRRELSLAAEGAEANRLENQELRSRLEKLEDQLNSLQRLLSLKDEQLAALQGQLGEDAPQLPQAEAMPQAEEESAQPDPAPEEKPVEAIAEQPAETQDLQTQTAAVEQPQAESQTQQPEPVTPKPMSMTADEHAGHDMAEEEGFLEGLLGSDMTLKIAAGGGVVMLLVILMVVSRMRKKAGAAADDFDPSSGDLSDGDADSDQVVSLVDTLVGEISLPDADEIPTEIDVGDDATEEAGLLAEADVYIAYNRYPEAEKLVREGITEDPGRQDLRVKLLEILHAMRNASDFDAQAEELHALVPSESDPVWIKVVSMGKELNPENTLYGSDGMDDDLPDDLDLEGTLNLGADAFAEMVEAEGDAIDEPPLDLDFELSLGDAADDEVAKTEVMEEAETESTDLEFDGMFAEESDADDSVDAADDSSMDLEFGSMFDDEETATIDTANFGDELSSVGEVNEETANIDSANFGDELSSVGEETANIDSANFGDELSSVGEDDDLDSIDDIEIDLEGTMEPGDDAFDKVETAQEDGDSIDLEFSADMDEAPSEDSGTLDLSLATMKGEIVEGDEPFAIEWDVTGLGEEAAAEMAAEEGPAADQGAVEDELSEEELAGIDSDNDAEVGDEIDAATMMEEVGDEDEMSNTKLDLATAYIEMGDTDGARGILEEVLEDGNSDQKSRAQVMIDQLD